MITPVPVPAAAIPLFEAQLPEHTRRPGTTVDFCYAREGGAFLDSYYDEVLASVFTWRLRKRRKTKVMMRSVSGQ